MAGANLLIFSTGLGTPTGNAVAPLIKVSSNTSLARRLPDIIDFDAMARHGTLDPEDLELFVKTNSVDEAFDFITTELTEHALAEPGGAL